MRHADSSSAALRFPRATAATSSPPDSPAARTSPPHSPSPRSLPRPNIATRLSSSPLGDRGTPSYSSAPQRKPAAPHAMMPSRSRSRSRSNSSSSSSASSHSNNSRRRRRNNNNNNSSSRSRSRSRSRSGSPASTRVHVGNIGDDPSKTALMKAFDKFGSVQELWLARTPPCFAFVVYRHRDDAQRAVTEMNGQMLHGNRLKVSIARPRTRGQRGGAFNPYLRCYQCGVRGHFSRDCKEVDRRQGYREWYGMVSA
ncbi:transformer-2 protein homolog beta-like isoform X2 [Pomacea canaliculata]|uniref:transformer-2 protein homolog beta-like isoform X2 n=1 Tax=Pomacea canaliculata TaxID=400727 RepID=UPI000D72C24E|nr:transformer-2 protein homolog beta-like isoform X2 [Pomacea canaliculata]